MEIRVRGEEGVAVAGCSCPIRYRNCVEIGYHARAKAVWTRPIAHRISVTWNAWCAVSKRIEEIHSKRSWCAPRNCRSRPETEDSSAKFRFSLTEA